jgi:hypothetical protein
MQKELDEYLVKRYPQIFSDRNGSIQETCMAWGFEVGDGWFHIIDRLCANIEGHIKYIEENNERNKKNLEKIKKGESVPEWVKNTYEENGLEVVPVPKVIANQVKEKFGTLRFYASGGDERIDDLISFAQSMSSVTCEECGGVGKTRGNGWVSTRCDTHARKEDVVVVNVEDPIVVLSNGEHIVLEVVEVISQEEVVGVYIEEDNWNDETEEVEVVKEPKQMYKAKYIKTSMLNYWNAEKIIV